MSVFKTDKAIYTPADFLMWNREKILQLSPNFQRNPVWRPSARSFLIDTILREMTIPPIYIRITQASGAQRSIREVVDGQQRIRAVMDFVTSDGFRLSKTLQADWAGKTFSELSDEERQRILNFGFPTEIFKGISDQQIYEAFCRLNMNGVALNKQELRNAKYFGLFKQSSYKLALEFLEFWRKNAIFSEQSIARMMEVQLSSELLIAVNLGMQDKKKSINTFYSDHDGVYKSQEKDERRFRRIMGMISLAFPKNELAGTEFSRPPLFYSLYCVVHHYCYGLPEIQRQSPMRKTLGGAERTSLRSAVQALSKVLRESKKPTSQVPDRYVAFVKACGRQTDNILPRKDRFNALYERAF